MQVRNKIRKFKQKNKSAAAYLFLCVNPTLIFILDLVNAVIEHGPVAFTNNILSSDDSYSKKEAISLVTSQYLSLREFSEKNHALTQEIITMSNYKDLDDLMVHIAKSMKSIFVADHVYFWMADAVNYTKNFVKNRKPKFTNPSIDDRHHIHVQLTALYAKGDDKSRTL